MNLAPAAFPPLDSESQDCSRTLGQVVLCPGMVGMGGQTGILDPRHTGMFLEELGSSLRILDMTIHADTQSFQPLQKEP